MPQPLFISRWNSEINSLGMVEGQGDSRNGFYLGSLELFTGVGKSHGVWGTGEVGNR